MRPGRTDFPKRLILKEEKTNPPTTFGNPIIIPDAANVNHGVEARRPMEPFGLRPSGSMGQVTGRVLRPLLLPPPHRLLYEEDRI